MEIGFSLIKLLPVVGSVFLFKAVVTLLSPKRQEGLSAASLVQAGPVVASGFGALNPQGNLLERLDYWLVKNLNLEKDLDTLHMMLGRPAKPTPLDMLHYKEAAFALGGFFMAYLLGPVGVIFAPVFFLIPDAALKAQVGTRQQAILGNFPQFVDLTALLIESGSDYMTAFDKICKVSKRKTDLEMEVEKLLGEMALGSSRKDALRHFADRVGVQEIRSFTGLIIQSEELGTSLVGLLREFATDMRFRRLNKAEKLAAQAATKMLFPMFVFIFPTVFILMLAPMVKEMVGGGLFQ